ncbi:MAG: transketolase C-terminal domain-containing protein, partial [Clostridiaceae bacterium]
LVAEALKAAEVLASRGIQARVVDMFTIKPIDLGCVRECAEKTGCVVTAENHSVIGGLGSAVAEALGETRPIPMERIGIKEAFGEVGSQDWLMDHFGLRAENIVQAAIRVIERKKNQ